MKVCVSPKCVSYLLGVICYECYVSRLNLRPSSLLIEQMVQNWRLSSPPGRFKR
jgi:hypothetical protein